MLFTMHFNGDFFMIKRVIAVILTVVLLVPLFSSCARGEGKDLFYPIYADPVSFDPQIASDNASKIVVYNCFEGLVRVDSDGKIIPGVATSWQISPDGLTYTFTLRSDAKWYMSEYAKKLLDSETAANFNYRVTAYDFVYGLRRAFNADMNPCADAGLYAIKNANEVYSKQLPETALGVTALNESTLKIELTAPNSNFLKALSTSAAMPCRKEFFEATKGRYGLDPETVIYNGPFYLYSWTLGSNLVLYKNESYSGEKEVKPASINLYINSDYATRVEKLKDKTYDACPLSLNQKKLLEGEKKISYLNYSNATWGFLFNCSSTAMKNSDMRTALAYAVDVTKIQLPAHCNSYAKGIVPDICFNGQTTYRNQVGKVGNLAVNKEMAQEKLESALKILDADYAKVKIICTKEFENTVKMAIQSWQSVLGVKVSFVLEAYDETEFESILNLNEHDIAFAKVTADSENVVSFLEMFNSTSEDSMVKYDSPVYNLLIESIKSEPNQSKVLANCLAAEKHLISSGVFIPMFNEDSYLGLAKGVSGIYCVEAGTVPIFIDGIRK